MIFLAPRSVDTSEVCLKLDETHCKILNLLQENCRMPLTTIAKSVGLSIDAVKKRMTKMIAEGVFHPRIQLRPRSFGFTNIVEAKIKLHHMTQEDLDLFVSHLQHHPRVVEFFALSGPSDFSIVYLAKNPVDQNAVVSNIRRTFGRIISSWEESSTLKVYKFEHYDMLKLHSDMGGESRK